MLEDSFAWVHKCMIMIALDDAYHSKLVPGMNNFCFVFFIRKIQCSFIIVSL